MEAKSNLHSIDTPFKKEYKIVELSAHTKYCTLEGISSPDDYLSSAVRKNYGALLITDFNSVQSFPEVYNSQKKTEQKLRFLYGCEFEMIEDQFPPFFVEKNDLLKEKNIKEITYCIIDIETTGLLSSYDELIEIGYLIIKDNKVVKESNFLIKPNATEIPLIINKITGITIEKLKDSLSVQQVLKLVRKEWEEFGVEVLIAHNGINFDFPFIDRFWRLVFNQSLDYPKIDTLLLSRVVFPDKRSYSLEKLSNLSKKKKDFIEQSHRALDDSLLLKNIFDKIIKIAKEKEFNYWEDFKSLIGDKFYFRGLGTKIKVIAKNQKGLSELYRLVKVSQIDNFFKAPFLFRSDLERSNRENLIIGSSGDLEGEIYSLFTTFGRLSQIDKKISFYDYVEVPLLTCFSHLTAVQRIKINDLKLLTLSVIKETRRNKKLAVSVSNVYYSDEYQKKIREVLVANEGVNGKMHQLYSYANNKHLGDNFDALPPQHLREKEEIISGWDFLNDWSLVNEITLKNPWQIVNSVQDIKILEEKIKYPVSEQQELDLLSTCSRRIFEIFPKWNIPAFAITRISKEWSIIKSKEYLLIYWLSWKVVAKAQEGNNIVGSRGSVGCSFIAYLLGITDINPLPLYTICDSCSLVKEVDTKQKILSSCYDYVERKSCQSCLGNVRYEGHSLPFETFVGWDGTKSADIDLNFSSEYQKVAHNHLREILGKKNVFRIGSISKISQQTAEIFWNQHLSLRKEINPNFNIYSWSQNFLEEYKKINQFDQSKIIDAKVLVTEQLKGIKRTTGQHPGGLLVVPPEKNIVDFTPLNFPADDTKSEWETTHYPYDALSEKFIKLDILANHQSETLESYSKRTGKWALDQNVVSFSDQKIMKVFTSSDTLGIPEFGTDFVKNFLRTIKPSLFSELVKISGFSHGTLVWLNNQQQIYKEKKLEIDDLVACREDILNLLDSKGVDKESAFIAAEFIRKGKWAKLDPLIKKKLEEKLTGEKGKIQLSILEKIEYIFPKPHAIAYTMAAWRTAYYKVYYPQVFYSNLLTYHAVVHDIWLMTLDVKKSILFKLTKLLDNIDTLKTARREFISICKVLTKLGRESQEINDFVEDVLSFNKFNSYESHYRRFGFDDQDVLDPVKLSKLSTIFSEKVENLKKRKTDVSCLNREKKEIDLQINLLQRSYQTLSDDDKRKIYDQRISLRKRIFSIFKAKELNDWSFSMKEKELLFTLKVVKEFREKGFEFLIGLDFNNSDASSFKFLEDKMLIPFFVITSVGPKVAEKIIKFREENLGISDWKKELRDIVNKKTFENFLDLENNGLIFSSKNNWQVDENLNVKKE